MTNLSKYDLDDTESDEVEFGDEEHPNFGDETPGVFIGKSIQSRRIQMFINICMDTKNIPLLVGPPGIGKTELIKSVVKSRKMFMRVLIGSTMDPTDVAGLPRLKELPDGSSITEFTKPDWFYEIEEFAHNNPQGACIFIDELTTTSPPVQAALLTFIQDRRIGKYTLPDNVLIIAAANPPSQAADGYQLAPPTANRFAHIEYKPSNTDWFAGMRIKWNDPNLSDREKQMRDYVVSFLIENKHLINAMPDDPEEASQAWPSMRTWDKAATMMSQASSQPMIEMILKAQVGKEAATAFIRWFKTLQLPRYEDVMAHPELVDWRTLRADALAMTLSTVAMNVTYENFEQSYEVFRAAKAAHKDDVIVSLIVLFKKETDAAFNAVNQDTVPLRRKFAELSHYILGKLIQG